MALNGCFIHNFGMNKMDKIMAAMAALFAASIASTIFMWSPIHHMGMGFVWLVFIVIVVLIVTREDSKRNTGRRRKR